MNNNRGGCPWSKGQQHEKKGRILWRKLGLSSGTDQTSVFFREKEHLCQGEEIIRRHSIVFVILCWFCEPLYFFFTGGFFWKPFQSNNHLKSIFTSSNWKLLARRDVLELLRISSHKFESVKVYPLWIEHYLLPGRCGFQAIFKTTIT